MTKERVGSAIQDEVIPKNLSVLDQNTSKRLRSKLTTPHGPPGIEMHRLLMRTEIESATGFEKVPISIWKISGKPVTIDEFIAAGSDRVDATGFRGALHSLNARRSEKLESINLEEYPDLREAIQLIIEALQSPEAWQAKDPLPLWLAEVAFGARYVLKRFDLIDDHLPEIGLADDARLLAHILERNLSELNRHRPTMNQRFS